MSVHSTTDLRNGHTLTVVHNAANADPGYVVQERDEFGTFIREIHCGGRLLDAEQATQRRNAAASVIGTVDPVWQADLRGLYRERDRRAAIFADRDGIWTAEGLEACEPMELFRGTLPDGLRVTISAEVVHVGNVCHVQGPFAAVVEFIRLHWGDEDREWFEDTISGMTGGDNAA